MSNTNTINALVTGSNGGLGLGICQRLIDDFLNDKNHEHATLNLIFTTRSPRKGQETLRTLDAHLQRYHSQPQLTRVTLQPENVELTSLLSVLTLARKLLASHLPKLDVVICNAGIGGWTGMDWWKVVPDIVWDIRSNTTWPRFKLGTIGAVTKKQLGDGGQEEIQEPPLGEVFCANVFGHYMLVHWLMPLLRACPVAAPGKIVWVSSVEPQGEHLRNEEDLQGLGTDGAYESSKRLTDVLALTANQRGVAQQMGTFYLTDSALTREVQTGGGPGERQVISTPTQHVFHPGIVVTSVVTLYWIVSQAYLLGIYIARWVGSVWATVLPYTAAAAATWLALATQVDIEEAEAKVRADAATTEAVLSNGRVKWGTAVDRSGRTTPRPTDVNLWGLAGTGVPFKERWWGGALGRKPGAADATSDDVHAFVDQGVQVWKQMEDLRLSWEKMIEEADNE